MMGKYPKLQPTIVNENLRSLEAIKNLQMVFIFYNSTIISLIEHYKSFTNGPLHFQMKFNQCKAQT
jgi:hypothetical protein